MPRCAANRPVTATRLLLAALATMLVAWQIASPDLSAYPWAYLRGGRPVGPDEALVEVVIVGDVMLGRGVSVADDPLADVAPWLRAADLALCNLEGVVTSSAAGAVSTHQTVEAGDEAATPRDICRSPEAADQSVVYHLPMPATAAGALRAAGFDLVGLANNHVLDCGPDGLAESVAYLEEAGITPLGVATDDDAAPAPLIRTVRGVRLAFLAFNMVPYPAGFGHLPADATPAQAAAAIAAARVAADAVIVSVHWGYEYQLRPDPAQRAAAQAMLAAGADLVVGHHPHVVQPVASMARSDTSREGVGISSGDAGGGGGVLLPTAWATSSSTSSSTRRATGWRCARSSTAAGCARCRCCRCAPVPGRA